jgi:hypothetical protein
LWSISGSEEGRPAAGRSEEGRSAVGHSEQGGPAVVCSQEGGSAAIHKGDGDGIHEGERRCELQRLRGGHDTGDDEDRKEEIDRRVTSERLTRKSIKNRGGGRS